MYDSYWPKAVYYYISQLEFSLYKPNNLLQTSQFNLIGKSASNKVQMSVLFSSTFENNRTCDEVNYGVNDSQRLK
jgi:hypothetical protein